jgi:hypothetical protein
VTQLPSADHYEGADSDPNGGVALAGTNFDRPFVYCPPSGSCAEGPPIASGADESQLFDVEYWGENGRYLVGGWFYGSGVPSQGEPHGLAQFNPSTGFEAFGYPTIGSNVYYWVEPDGFGNGWVREIFELDLPGRALDKAVIIGGHFGWVFGSAPGQDLTTSAQYVAWLNPDDWRFYNFEGHLPGQPFAFAQSPGIGGHFGWVFGSAPGQDLTTSAQYVAWLNPDDWRFYNFEGHLPGQPFAFAQSPGYDAGDGGTFLYASGSFGLQEPGLEHASVQRSDVGGNWAGGFEPVPPGPPPYGGPMKDGTNEYAVVTGMAATKDFLYVVGDFDLVRTKSGAGGVLIVADRFARFSFATQTWQSLGVDAIGGPVGAIDINWPAVFVGGSFTTVGGSTASFHIGEGDFTEAVGVPESPSGVGWLAPIRLEKPMPNPTRSGSSIGFTVPRSMHVDLAIFDVTGRLVRKVVEGIRDTGEYVAEWDGRTANGDRAASGPYFVRLFAEDVVLSEKIVLMK